MKNEQVKEKRQTHSRWTRIFLPSVQFSDLHSSPSDLPKYEALKQTRFRHRQRTFRHTNMQRNGYLEDNNVVTLSILTGTRQSVHLRHTSCPILSMIATAAAAAGLSRTSANAPIPLPTQHSWSTALSSHISSVLEQGAPTPHGTNSRQLQRGGVTGIAIPNPVPLPSRWLLPLRTPWQRAGRVTAIGEHSALGGLGWDPQRLPELRACPRGRGPGSPARQRPRPWRRRRAGPSRSYPVLCPAAAAGQSRQQNPAGQGSAGTPLVSRPGAPRRWRGWGHAAPVTGLSPGGSPPWRLAGRTRNGAAALRSFLPSRGLWRGAWLAGGSAGPASLGAGPVGLGGARRSAASRSSVCPPGKGTPLRAPGSWNGRASCAQWLELRWAVLKSERALGFLTSHWGSGPFQVMLTDPGPQFWPFTLPRLQW